MKSVALSACLLLSLISFAQTTPAIPEGGKGTLAEQYLTMKKNASTYEDYKVVKEYALDAVWKSAADSLKAAKRALQDAMTVIAARESDINTLRSSLKLKEDSMADVEFASTHIKVFGVNFKKGFFLFLAAAIVVSLLVVIAAMTGRVKWTYLAMKEKVEGINVLASEYEDFKRKALEKQMKLSRELQTERNKLSEFKIQKA